MFKIILILLLLPLQSFAFDKIVGGVVPAADHPSKYNTVAFIKTSNNKVFCTGSLISKTMVLTAKHCLIGKQTKDFSVFFGDDTNKLEQGIIRQPKAMKVRRPIDWEMTFPSFDVAWVELEEEAPKGYRPLPILSSKEELPSTAVHLAGHGNSSLTNGKIEAGKKFTTTTNLKTYYDNARFFHILLFEGVEGTGSCHGDSGGPAYIQTKMGWAIIGVTNGFDVVLTPRSMTRTSDSDFPYRIDCKKNQNLYSFAGAHGAWIEKTSNKKILKTKDFKELDAAKAGANKDLLQWCERRDFGSPRWNLLKLILDIKVDSMPQADAEAFYNNCDEVEQYLRNLTEIRINGEKTMDASYSLAPLHLLNLEQLKIFNSDIGLFDFQSSNLTTIKELTLNKVKLQNLDFLRKADLRLQSLDLALNPLTSISGIEKIEGLKAVLLSRTLVEDFTPLLNFPDIEELDLSSTPLSSTQILGNFKLKKLVIGGEALKEINFAGQKGLETLWISPTKLFDINLLKETPNLVSAHLPYLNIKDLSVFSIFNFDSLESLNLTGNPISSLGALMGLKSLVKLRLFGTPLAKREVAKTPDNCPITGPKVLTRFCSNL
jgi:hypothetical protein